MFRKFVCLDVIENMTIDFFEISSCFHLKKKTTFSWQCTRRQTKTTSLSAQLFFHFYKILIQLLLQFSLSSNLICVYFRSYTQYIFSFGRLFFLFLFERLFFFLSDKRFQHEFMLLIFIVDVSFILRLKRKKIPAFSRTFSLGFQV